MSDILNHLWQSTLFALLMAAAAAALHRNEARIRYGLWFAASIKFLIPFAVLLALGWRAGSPVPAPAVRALTVERATATFAPIPDLHNTLPEAKSFPWAPTLGAVWILGAAVVLAYWFQCWRRIHRIRAGARPVPISAPIPVLATASPLEPGVFGVFRPVLLLSEGVLERLSPEELDTVLAHEMAHASRRDNLTASIHMLTQALFWFHPLVWWIGSRLAAEREHACDEAVLKSGAASQTYASGIINVCRHNIESPLFCAPGMSGGDLRRRIEQIVTWRPARGLSVSSALALALLIALALAAPVTIGVLRAQTLPPPPKYKFEVVSIRPSKAADNSNRLGPGPQGGLRAQNVTTLQLVGFAYGVRPFLVTGGPGWLRTDRYDVVGTPAEPEEAVNPGVSREKFEGSVARLRQRVQALLSERYGLVVRAETREMPVYTLSLAKGGPKLAETKNPNPPGMSSRPGWVKGSGANMRMLADSLSGLLQRPVLNETGLDGIFDFELSWEPDPRPDDPNPAPAGNGPSLFTAIQETLGLKLDAKKGPAPVFVVEKIDRPSEN